MNNRDNHPNRGVATLNCVFVGESGGAVFNDRARMMDG